MRQPHRWTKRLGLTAKLTIPFAVIFIVALTGLGVVSIHSSRTIMFELLVKRVEGTVRTLAGTLPDQQILQEAMKADPNIIYAYLVNRDGKALVSSDPAL